MRGDGRARGVAPLAVAVAVALAIAGAGPALAGSGESRHPVRTTVVVGGVAVETAHFGGRRRGGTVRVVRGMPRVARLPPPALPRPRSSDAPPPLRTQTVSFGDGTTRRVTIVRGIVAMRANRDPRIERVSFADPLLAAVTVIRGLAPPASAVDLFDPASGGELDRVAFAVDGIESRHGADPRMWRPEPQGPQGPMQVSAAAATDVGGGDRFDLRANRVLGRAYLAQMYRRYGNWVDALAAYNWGPANVDQWIAGGHRLDALPPEVLWYVGRALHDALITVASGP